MFCLVCVNFESVAQTTNAWTNSASGYWEQPHWSLGILPGPNQDILFTNAFQALAIGTNTVQTAPNTLNVQSITLAAPPNSINTLLLNYAGVQNPLQLGVATNTANGYLGSLLVGSNSTVLILDSALQVNNQSNATERGAFSIGGTVNQGAFSQVSAAFMHLGDIGPGVYNLTNGSVSISSEYIGSVPYGPTPFVGTFNQFGGSNSSYLQIGFGNYNLYDGDFPGTLVIWNGGNFNQYGGSFSADMHLFSGNYLLAGGTFAVAALTIAEFAPPGPQQIAQSASFVQTGSTNSCTSLELNGGPPSDIGFYGASGFYNLSNGTLWVAGPEAIQSSSTFNQSGGIHTNAGISMTGVYRIPGGAPVPSYFNLNGGLLSTPSLTVQGSIFTETNGTNQVNGNVLVTGGDYTPSVYNLSGGLLSDSNATASFLFGFIQSGGTHTVANQLTLSGQRSFGAPSDCYVLSGGALSAPIIQVDSGNSFRHTGGTLTNNGRLILSDGSWSEQTAGQQFGALQLGANTSFFGANALSLPPGSNCVLQFTISSGLTWSNQLTLNILNWNGSLNGGGQHRVIFGNNSSALTAQQLSQISFINPDGGSGVFPAQILSTGEIVPAPALFLLAQPGAGKLVLQWPSGATLQSATNLSGPWQDVSSATSPYTNFLAGPRQFFRLRQ
jgi:hypothetical protein